MTNDVGLDALRDQVLRKIGRNIVNLQKMEAMLKLLNTQQALSGSPKDIMKILADASKSVARQPMGRLADAFVRSFYSSDHEKASVREDPKEIAVSLSMRIEADSGVVKETKRALRSIVEGRNKLIHKWLAGFDPNSIQSCIELRNALDLQHERILSEFEMLKSILRTFDELRNELQRFVASDEFLAELQSHGPGA